MSPKSEVQSLKSVISRERLTVSILLFLLLTAHCSLLTVSAHEGEDHSKDKPKVTTGAKQAASVVRAERNVQTDAGQFNARFERSPADPRTGELVQMAVKLSERVEGGFGGGEPLPLDGGANATLDVTSADGVAAAQNLRVTFENGFHRADYAFAQPGNYKTIFNVTTADKRTFKIDFPVTVTSAPLNRYFWLGTTALALLSFGAVGAVFYRYGRNHNSDFGNRLRIVAPFAIAATLFFALGTFALAYIAPPREQRATVDFVPTGETAALETTASGLSSSLTVTKESQLLFGIKTVPIETRQIASGLKTTGVVRARPDARAVVVPPVSGRIVLRQGLTIGSAVGRSEQIGTVEQVLDVSGQTELESQRLEVEAQQREVEARRLEIRNTVLALQTQQNERRAAAQTARTRLEQARRELRRSENLLEAGAIPRRRVEEAQTAVSVAEQEIAAAERQIEDINRQIRQAEAGQNVFRQPAVRQPSRVFALTAPVAGVVNEIRATSGSQLESGTEILSIVNLSTVLLEANVFERDLPRVRESIRASFTSPALNGEIYRIGEADGDGRLVSIGQTVNPETRAVPVLYEVKNPLGRLRDGNFVEITIDTGGDQRLLAVPKAAVVNEQGQTFVFVFQSGESFERRAVRLGVEGADYYEVQSGLKEGERVVTEGVYQLRSTQPGA